MKYLIALCIMFSTPAYAQQTPRQWAGEMLESFDEMLEAMYVVTTMYDVSSTAARQEAKKLREEIKTMNTETREMLIDQLKRQGTSYEDIREDVMRDINGSINAQMSNSSMGAGEVSNYLGSIAIQLNSRMDRIERNMDRLEGMITGRQPVERTPSPTRQRTYDPNRPQREIIGGGRTAPSVGPRSQPRKKQEKKQEPRRGPQHR